MLPFKLVYHERYDLNLGAHVFPSQKFRLIAEALLAEGIGHHRPHDAGRGDGGGGRLAARRFRGLAVGSG